MTHSLAELTEALEQFDRTNAAGAGPDERDLAALRVANTSRRVLAVVSTTRALVPLLIDDDKTVYVQGLYANADAAMAGLRQYLVDRFGEDAVSQAESDEEQGLGSLVHYKTDSFDIPVIYGIDGSALDSLPGEHDVEDFDDEDICKDPFGEACRSSLDDSQGWAGCCGNCADRMEGLHNPEDATEDSDWGDDCVISEDGSYCLTCQTGVV